MRYEGRREEEREIIVILPCFDPVCEVKSRGHYFNNADLSNRNNKALLLEVYQKKKIKVENVRKKEAKIALCHLPQQAIMYQSLEPHVDMVGWRQTK